MQKYLIRMQQINEIQSQIVMWVGCIFRRDDALLVMMPSWLKVFQKTKLDTRKIVFILGKEWLSTKVSARSPLGSRFLCPSLTCWTVLQFTCLGNFPSCACPLCFLQTPSVDQWKLQAVMPSPSFTELQTRPTSGEIGVPPSRWQLEISRYYHWFPGDRGQFPWINGCSTGWTLWY